MYIPDIKLLTQKPVLYAVYENRTVISYGVGGSASRLVTKLVINLGIKEQDFVSVNDQGVTTGRFSVRYCEFDARMKAAFPTPGNAKQDENVERLLQALHTWQHGTPPREDGVRGLGTRYGGWIAGSPLYLDNLLALYGWFDEIKKPWPAALVNHGHALYAGAKRLVLYVSSTSAAITLGHCNKQTKGSVQYNTCNTLGLPIP